MNHGYVYKTTNLTDGKTYMGKKKGRINKSYLGSGILMKGRHVSPSTEFK